MKKIINTIWGWIKGEMYVIEQRSANALGAFQEVMDDLKVVEARIESSVAKKTAKADKLAKEVAALAATKEKNSRVANKINEFLNA